MMVYDGDHVGYCLATLHVNIFIILSFSYQMKTMLREPCGLELKVLLSWNNGRPC